MSTFHENGYNSLTWDDVTVCRVCRAVAKYSRKLSSRMYYASGLHTLHRDSAGGGFQ